MNNRYDFVFLFDVTDGNPNGDPDAGNLPRVDPETGHGLVTDVCLKRKIRNFVGTVKEEQPPFEIYVKERAILNSQHARAYTESDQLKIIKEKLEQLHSLKKNKKRTDDEETLFTTLKTEVGSIDTVDIAKRWVCDNFFDVRTFGAVMSTGDEDKRCGQVRGPVQMAFSRSIDPIIASEHALTVCAARMEPTKAQTKDEAITAQTGIQGRKFTIPYGLYRCHGFINPYLADKTGFSDDDLELFWTALGQMFELDRSASHGQMSPRGLIVFKHESKLGNAHAHLLQERVQVARKDGIEVARSFDDYAVTINENDLPSGIEVIRHI